MAYILGVDIGTSGTKTVLFSEDGTPVASALYDLHHLIRCTLCAEYRSALSKYAGKILRLHYTAVIMDQTVETVGYADYLNVVLAEHGVTGFCRTSYSSVKSGAVASARQYTDSALCHLYIQPFLKDLLFSAN